MSIDSRTLFPGNIFFALPGDNFDGHAYIGDVRALGASAIVVSQENIKGDDIIYVKNTERALQMLAARHRSTFEIPVIAITGSNGKTTTKELLARVLSEAFETIATKGNLNNHLGVPLTLLRISDETEVAVIEMGANHIGEVAALCAIAKPTHGLITNIGRAHLQGFGSFEGVKQGKSELFQHLASNNGLAFVNLSEPHLSDLAAGVDQQVTYAVSTDITILNVDYNFSIDDIPDGIVLSLLNGSEQAINFVSQLYGAYNAANLASAVSVGLYLGVPVDHIAMAIAGYKSENNRSETLKIAGKTVILDAYNANPTSMEAAIRGFSTQLPPRGLILGGMNELGMYEQEEHARIIKLLSKYNWAHILLIGPPFNFDHGLANTSWFKNVDDCKSYLSQTKLSCSSILIKGSRSLASNHSLTVSSE